MKEKTKGIKVNGIRVDCIIDADDIVMLTYCENEMYL